MKPTKKRNRPKPRGVRRWAYAAGQQMAPEQPLGEPPAYEEICAATEALLKVQREFLCNKEAVVLELPGGGAFITFKTIGEKGWWE